MHLQNCDKHVAAEQMKNFSSVSYVKFTECGQHVKTLQDCQISPMHQPQPFKVFHTSKAPIHALEMCLM